MTALGITRLRIAVLPLLSLALLGCGTATPPGTEPSPHAAVGSNDPAWVTHRHSMPPPDTDRINYDEQTRMLTLYDLPGNDRWMMKRAGEDSGRFVTPQHRLPPDVDLSDVMVYYARPGVKPSSSVSVKQIRDTGHVHSSNAGVR